LRQFLYALLSHERAAAAQGRGLFDDEMVPVATAVGEVRGDEGVRRGATLEKLASLPTLFVDSGEISAGNSSQISDGAAAVLITTSERAAALGLTPLVRIHSAVVAGEDPVKMLTGPIPATQLALKRSGLWSTTHWAGRSVSTRLESTSATRTFRSCSAPGCWGRCTSCRQPLRRCATLIMRSSSTLDQPLE
jgi:hypothetical protein